MGRSRPLISSLHLISLVLTFFRVQTVRRIRHEVRRAMSYDSNFPGVVPRNRGIFSRIQILARQRVQTHHMALSIDTLFRIKRDRDDSIKSIVVLEKTEHTGLPGGIVLANAKDKTKVPSGGPQIPLLQEEWELLRSHRRALERYWGVSFEAEGSHQAKSEAKTLVRLLLRCFDPKTARPPACLGIEQVEGASSPSAFLDYERSLERLEKVPLCPMTCQLCLHAMLACS